MQIYVLAEWRRNYKLNFQKKKTNSLITVL